MSKISLDQKVYSFFESKIYQINNFNSANVIIYSICGIKDFFICNEDFIKVKSRLKLNQSLIKEDSRVEYGDYQTPESLADLITNRIISDNPPPTIVLEPTSGKGAFITSVLKHTNNFAKYYCMEIYKPYIWISKFKILEIFLNSEYRKVPHIEFFHQNVYNANLNEIVKPNSNDYLLVIGNPPWVTNSQLGVLDSNNLPIKSNFKGHNGFDAITGKGNFDIAEYISLMVLKSFSTFNGVLAFLLKNIVIKNLLNDQKSNKFRIGGISQLSINAKKEFNVNTDASLLYCKLNSDPEYQCKRSSIYNDIAKETDYFGFFDGKFVSSINKYQKYKKYDGKSTLIWRQGVKHDCSKVMELEQIGNDYINKNNDKTILEEDLMYGLLKSSDLNKDVIETVRKFTIITQKKIGEDTSYISQKYPKTFKYLNKNKAYFEARRSKIYRDKPPFSIFGIGRYSFYKYKVSISGLYKQAKFSLVLPINNKPVMLDDTCYFVGFDNIIESVIVLLALNHKSTQQLLNSLIFYDSKRVITKDILMRIDLISVLNTIPLNYFNETIENNYSNLCEKVSLDKFEKIVETIAYRDSRLNQSELLKL